MLYKGISDFTSNTKVSMFLLYWRFFILKRIFSILLFLFLAFTIYHDLTIGSLPIKPKEASQKQTNQAIETKKISYINWIVQPGDTVLSIHEHLSDGTHSNISIEQIITDFETLNPSTHASDIKIGHTYKFPIYQNSTDVLPKQNFS